MDDLEFRRRAYAEPDCRDDEFLEKMKSSQDNQKFVTELQKFDQRIKEAMSIDVPEGLAERILLNQTLSQDDQKKQRIKLVFSIAASVLVMVSLFFVFSPSSNSNIDQQVLTHIYQELDHLNEHQNNDMQRINIMLRSFGGSLKHEIGQVNYLGSCNIANKEGIHMVLAGSKGPVTVMLLPQLDIDNTRFISDQRFSGSVFPVAKGSMVIIGGHGERLEEIKQKLESGISWVI
ncbi:MAG: DUF3379 domain-containing protein [Gammaproteobacteria bacterium]|nr:DUF3379 domain-containing protein [Gammaproteobacteria bacterium]